jgi:long-chain acyl-CoA synthetase
VQIQLKIGDLPRGAARTSPDEIAVIHENTRVSFSEFYQNAKILSQNFLKLGIQLGDRIAILTYNCPEILYSFYAVPLTGAVITPLNYAMSVREIQYCVTDCAPRALIYQPAFESTIQQMKQAGSPIEHYISTAQFQEMLKEPPSIEQKAPHFSHEATCFIIWTGGTTGFPKGVMISHRNMIAMIAMAGEMLVKGTDKFKESFVSEKLTSKMLTALPLFHGAGLFLALCNMFGGITFITQEQFDVVPTLQTIEREHASFLALVPTMLKRLIESPELMKYDLRSLRTIIYGAAPITPTTLGKALDTFPNSDFVQVFGQTEASPVLCIMDALDHAKARKNRDLLTSCGRALHGIEVKIVDPFGKEVPRGEVGEIIARGENIMQGYWGKPEKTAETLRDGWLHTEDLGRIDEDGYIYITGRGKDMIVSGGENIYPIEVEDALQSHPAVLEVGVIGIPDENWGEKVHAIVVLNKGYEPGKNVSETELIAHVKQQIASYKAPKSVSFTHSLPRSPQGKILKRVLREPYWKDKERQIH